MDQNKWANDEIAKLDAQVKSKTLADTTFKRMAMEATANTLAITALIKTDDQATYKDVNFQIYKPFVR